MRIVVLGATSRTGLCLLGEAARRGDQVVAFTRRPEVLPRSPALAAVVQGDARDPGLLDSALAKADAVVSLLPGGTRRDPHLAADTARALVTAMPAAGVRRLVAVSAYPVVGDRPAAVIWLLRRILARPYADIREMEQLLTASDLDWTIARLNRLTSKPATGEITTSTQLLPRPRPHSRADAAAVLLDLAAQPAMARTAVNVSGT
ncbi:MAG: NAD(P)-dependent oxidoreductase [Trebonia sp.]